MVPFLTGSLCYLEFLRDQCGLVLLIYVDDIHHRLCCSSVQIFADDITLYKEITPLSEQELQSDLNQVYA